MINAKITDIPIPVTRTEHFMYSAITGNESGLKADTQAEMYLDAIKNGDTSDLEDIEPRTILDMYLEARQTGVVDDLPKPRTTSEMLLYQAITGEDLGAKPVSNMDKYLSLLEPNNYDARLEIESEESVIHLTDSKNGVVEVKELEGNTMVNYVTDGSKELTLNGDIDVEGTSVTLTEGVDNGLVDVMCEGNTLVNEIKFRFKDTVSSPPCVVFTQIRGLKPNTTYTAITPYFDGSTVQMYIGYNGGQGIVSYQKNNIVKFTTGDTIHTDEIWFYYRGTDSPSLVSTLLTTHVILEGDWTDKEIPEYFEGMKSVAECEDNKIEILSQKIGDLILETEQGDIDVTSGENANDNQRIRAKNFTEVKPNTTYELERSIVSRNLGIRFYDINKKYIPNSNTHTNLGILNFTTPNNCKYIKFIDESNNLNSVHKLLSVTISLNKKEITLSEPLRALPNGVKDKIVKVGGKWYVERNCGEKIIDGSDVAFTNVVGYPSDNAHCILTSRLNNLKLGSVVCDKLPTYSANNSIWMGGIMGDKNGISTVSNDWGFAVRLLNSLTSVNKADDYDTVISKFKTYLQNNPITVIYELTTPIYEEIADPTLTTYNDTTHISNNSTIPCNMQVKNTGYNAIIKPSTQYTVAFDGNASGEVGINLGGSKVTTNNNVATVTTPSTLVDDSLRVTGKGIKASKVRLLEGDKTNWVPSYFEGMKSSFEDKLQNDGTFKMEILSNNGNLFNFEFLTLVRNNCALPLKYLEVGKTYTVKTNSNVWFKVADHLDSGQFSYQIVNKDTFTFKMTRPMKNQYLFINNKDITPIKDINVLKNLQPNIRLGNSITSLIESKSNKIQFSSIEPLRGVGDVKDRFVFKDDGRLMIERNCKERVLSGSENWAYESLSVSDNATAFSLSSVLGLQPSKERNLILSDKFVNSSSNIATDDYECIGTSTGKDMVIVKLLKNKFTDSTSVIEFKNWLQANPFKVVYQLKKPTYEEITPELQKLILKCYDNATLFFDTNIPPKSLISYTANTSNIYRYLDTLKLSKEECDLVINSMERV